MLAIEAGLTCINATPMALGPPGPLATGASGTRKRRYAATQGAKP
jgi:hypothetical protein